MSDAVSDFLRQLTLLRWIAVASQSVVVLVVVRTIGVPLEQFWLWLGIAFLALFNALAPWLARRTRTSVAVALAFVAIDIAQLAWMIGWSGGAMNPFTSLFLLPVALVAVSFRPLAVFVTAGLSGVAYAAATATASPLPMVHDSLGRMVNMHLWGMAVNFLVSCVVFAMFLARLSGAVRERDHELARIRERFARNEGILALATHAASVAHELNTPLGALTLLIEDQLALAPASDIARRGELNEMAQLVDACRDRVRQLAAPAEGRSDADARWVLDSAVQRWQLLRPMIELQRSDRLDPASGATLDPAVGHLLQVLLNNAADASMAAGSEKVELDISATAQRLVGRVRDFGHGIDAADGRDAGALFSSTKPDGLGIGLALSHATLERLGGDMSLRRHEHGGTEVTFHVPLQPATVLTP